ncbi:MAG: hypothetical protein PWP04_12 [Candidatus Atribacteria bacterium]|nr:hypothetical protein [Candidatus Atribacteria bacterium]
MRKSKYTGTWAVFDEDYKRGFDDVFRRYAENGIKNVMYGGIALIFDIHKEYYIDTCIDPYTEIEYYKEVGDVFGTKEILIESDFNEVNSIADKYGLSLQLVITPGVSEPIVAKHPSTAVVDIYGNKSPHWMCPSNPDVQQYFFGRIEDILRRYKIGEVELDVICLDFYDPQVVPDWVLPELYPLRQLAIRNCFCKHCIEKAKKAGLNLAKIESEIKVLNDEARSLKYEQFKKWDDTIRGVFDIIRFVLNHPMLIDWLRFRASVVEDFVFDIKNVIKKINSDILLSSDLVSPSFSWTLGQIYSEQPRLTDITKLMLYHKRIGSFEVKPLRRIKSAIPQIKDEELMRQYYRLKGFSGPLTFDEFEREGIDAENIYYEVKKAKVEVGPDYPIVAGLVGDPPATAKDVKEAVKMAYKGGADGYMLHQWYGNTPIENIEAFGEQLRELGEING